ncbi:MAG: hypothetical protein RL173_1059 [Fibrobacterota bacterium]|jgi:hypothetical protein
MKFSNLGILIAAVAITQARAELELPRGLDLPLPTGTAPDTLDIETLVTGTYLIAGYSEAVSLQYWKSQLPSVKYQFDTRTKTYSAHDKGWIARIDSAGLTSRVVADAVYDAGGKVHLETRRGYDGLGRIVTEYVYSGASTLVLVDSTRWVWKHPDCADEYRSDLRWIWKTGSDGRCLEGSFQLPDPTAVSGWSEDHRLGLVWSGRHLKAAFEVQLGDTMTREEYVYTPDSLVSSISTYSLDGSWYLAENTSYTYLAGRFVKSVAQGFDSTGTVFARAVRTARQRTADMSRSSDSHQGTFAAKRLGSTVLFVNTTSEPLHVAVFAPDGSRRADLVVAAGQKLEWAAPAGDGALYWHARGASYSASGALAPGR